MVSCLRGRLKGLLPRAGPPRVTFDAIAAPHPDSPCWPSARWLPPRAPKRRSKWLSADVRLQFAAAIAPFADWQNTHPTIPWGPLPTLPRICRRIRPPAHFAVRVLHSRQHFMTDHKLAPDPWPSASSMPALDATRRLAARSPQNPDCQFAMILANGLHSDYLALMRTLRRFVSGNESQPCRGGAAAAGTRECTTRGSRLASRTTC